MSKILVVDDERSIRLTVKAFLENEGYQVEIAEDPEAAITLLQSFDFDVVLTDIVLPRLSGVELLRRIREFAPKVLVIMMTGEPTMETASESLRLGAVDYLQKPVSKQQILKVVHNAINIKQLSDAKERLEEENRTYLSRLERLVEQRTRALAKSEAALRRQAEKLVVQNRLISRMNTSITVDEAVRCGLSEIVSSLTPDLALFFLLEEEKLVLAGSLPDPLPGGWQPEVEHRAGLCLCGLAARDGVAIYCRDIRLDRRCTLAECRNSGFRSLAALPLQSGNETIGVLVLASLAVRDFAEHAEQTEALVNEIAVGLKKNLLYREVRRHSQELKNSLARIEASEAERRSLEQHLQRSQKMEAIGTLASGIAHDFNNILMGVVGYTELALLGMSPEARSRRNLEMVLTAADRAKELVVQILSFSRQSEEERKPLCIGNIIKEVLKFLRASLPSTITLRDNTDAVAATIAADPVQIHQVFMNLGSNALHAMKGKSGLLEVRLAKVHLTPAESAALPELEPGPYVKVTVSDNGIGMDQATLRRIFDPYFTTKEKGVGTGLGLAVVHSIIKKHGGAIVVSSERGVGTRFDLYFPAIDEVETANISNSLEVPRGSERILVVDDEIFLAEMISEMLGYLGYRVESRTSSTEAVALFKNRPNDFDLVITDMTMPGMTGDRLAEEILAVRGDIPIVLCTGYSDRILADRAQALGIKGVVMKPILMGKLATVLREALRK